MSNSSGFAWFKINILQRVKNNRRVNYQKAEAIRLGREHLGEEGQGKGKPMLKTRKREQAQMHDSQNDEEDSGDETRSDGGTDMSLFALGPKSVRPNPHTPKRTKFVSYSKHQPVSGVMINFSLSQSTNSNQYQEQKGRVQASHLPQAQNQCDSFAWDPNQNVYAPTQPTQMLSEHDRMIHGLADGQQMSTLNHRYNFQPGSESGNVFHGDNSTGGSDSEGLGNTGYGYS